MSGWKLVPVEPTPDMIASGIDGHYPGNQIIYPDEHAGPEEAVSAAYRAMLAAAPSPSPSSHGELVERLNALHAKAPSGSWENHDTCVFFKGDERGGFDLRHAPLPKETAEWIAAIHNAWPALVTERDEALSRVDELEASAEVVAAEHEGELWKAIRPLCKERGMEWRDCPDGVSADDVVAYLREEMESETRERETLKLERDEQHGRAVLNLHQLNNWRDRATAAEAERDALRETLRECHGALAMMVAPDAIKQTTVINAFAAATAAEAKASATLSRIKKEGDHGT